MIVFELVLEMVLIGAIILGGFVGILGYGYCFLMLIRYLRYEMENRENKGENVENEGKKDENNE